MSLFLTPFDYGLQRYIGKRITRLYYHEVSIAKLRRVVLISHMSIY